MIVVKLQGGLGNQMFQYAVARSLSKGKIVYLDLQFLIENNFDTDHFTARKLEIDVFKNIKAKKAKPFQTQVFTSQNLFIRKSRKLFRSEINIAKQFENEIFDFSKINSSKYIYLDGYFQSEEYFKEIREEILFEFTFPTLDEKNKCWSNKIASTLEPTSLHVRRGDYLKSNQINSIHNVIPLEYYTKSINLLRKNHPNISLFIFSDDINWAKENLKFSGIDLNFIDLNHGEDSWKDMFLMSCCKHHIIANSSFSWWGAWLSQKNGITCAPLKWFNPQNVKFNIANFIPPHWMIISYE